MHFKRPFLFLNFKPEYIFLINFYKLWLNVKINNSLGSVNIKLIMSLAERIQDLSNLSTAIGLLMKSPTNPDSFIPIKLTL